MNEAYNTLRDPFSRAEYLLALDGGPSAAEQKQTPPAFLAEMLGARERIEETRAGCPDDARILADEFGARYDGLLAEVADSFAAYEQLPSEDPKRAALRVEIRSLLNAARYIRGLVRDLNAG